MKDAAKDGNGQKRHRKTMEWKNAFWVPLILLFEDWKSSLIALLYILKNYIWM